MKSSIPAIRARLLADAGVTAIVADRVWSFEAEEGLSFPDLVIYPVETSKVSSNGKVLEAKRKPSTITPFDVKAALPSAFMTAIPSASAPENLRSRHPTEIRSDQGGMTPAIEPVPSDEQSL